jgi:hypothetical protein
MGVTVSALIVGVSVGTDGTFTQSLSVRIISAQSSFTTYAEHNNALAAGNLTYTQWQALGPNPQTYEQFNAAA